MKRSPGSSLSSFVSLRILGALLALVVLPLGVWAAGPAWWTQRGVIAVDSRNTPLPADDFAAANEGQLKQIASQALAELQASAPGGIGSMQAPDGTGYLLQQLVSGWNNPNAATDDYAAVNLGQLKAVAKPFYDRLIEIGYASAYPWADPVAAPDDFAIANLGQVKNLFSFDLKTSSQNDGIPDWWKLAYGFGILDPSVAEAPAPNGDGLTILENYRDGINPLDYYNGVLPSIQIVSGNNQTGSAGQPLAQPLVVSVMDPEGNVLANAPVQFSVAGGNGWLAGSSTEMAVTGADGKASVSLQLGSGLTGANLVAASIATGGNTASVTFTATANPLLTPGAFGGCMLSSGGYSTGAFSVGVKADGSVWAWGNNFSGQLGNGSFTSSSTPVQVLGAPAVVAASAGESFVAALDQYGSVWTWGDNSHWQVGGTDSMVSAPSQVQGLYGIVFVTAGLYHVLAVDASGSVWAWGSNLQGQLGTGGVDNTSTPGQVLDFQDATSVAAGLDVSIALKSDGTVWEWGGAYGGAPAQVGGLTGIISVAAAPDDSALAVDQSGHVWSWTPGNTPMQVAGLASVTAVSAGVYGAGMAVDTGGNVWTWPGTGIAPAPVAGLASASGVSWAHGYSLALASNGNIYGWGKTSLLGNLPPESTATALQIPVLSNVTAATSGDAHSLCVKSDGTVWAWGGNSQGQLGNATTVDSTVPLRVPGVTGASAVSAGANHSLVIAHGALYAWGENGEGQLGTGDTTGSPHSSPAPLGTAGTFVSVAAGRTHSLAVDSLGGVWSWGANWQGQLGNGDSSGAIQYAPVQAVWTGTAPAVTAISAGDDHSLALDATGRVWAWGGDGDGQLGNGDTTGVRQVSPVAVSGLSNIVAVSAGGVHSLALDGAGSVWAWGSNGNGQLGNGDTSGATRYAPVQVSGLTNVVAVAAGEDYSLAVRSDGTVWAWGDNGNGQLGTGTTTSSYSPVQAAWVGQAAKIFAGYRAAMILTSAQTLEAWGSNANGQAGLGLEETQVTAPEIVLGVNLMRS